MKIQIETTQNVYIEYEIASLGDRILAYIIDFVISFAYIIIASYALSETDLLNDTTNVVLLSIPFLLYEVICEILFDGKTVGKIARNIKVISMDGRQPSIGSYLLRWLLRPIDIWIGQGGIGMMAIALNGKGQRLGDLVANTCVISTVQKIDEYKKMTPEIDDNYEPMFPQVTQLTDEEVDLVKEVLQSYYKNRQSEPIRRLATNIQQHLQIETEEPALNFLKFVVYDYHHLMSGGWR